MSDVQSRERSPETASGAQREPDERVRELQRRLERCREIICGLPRADSIEGPLLSLAFDYDAALRRLRAREAVYEERLESMAGTIAEQAGRLQAAQRDHAPAPAGWRSIKSAPMDGTRFLAYWPHWEKRWPVICWRGISFWEARERIAELDVTPPLLWHPLPETPK